MRKTTGAAWERRIKKPKEIKANSKSRLILTVKERGPGLSLTAEKVLLAPEPVGAMKLTSIQQQLDRQVVISQHGVVQSCAALEIGPDVQAVVEVVLPGHKDCRGKKKESSAQQDKVKNCFTCTSSTDHQHGSGGFLRT